MYIVIIIIVVVVFVVVVDIALPIPLACPNNGNNNNNDYLECLTRTGPKRLHILYKYILSKFNAYNEVRQGFKG